MPSMRGGIDPPGRVRAVTAHRIHLLLAGLLAIGAVVVVGLSEVAGFGWGWTGFPENGELWDWLHLLVLPLVLMLLPLWVSTHRRWRREWLMALVAVGAAFLVIVYGGYELGWGWTGFSGNHLWDWLELLVLPFAVALLPVWLAARGHLASRHLAGVGAAVLVFAVVVVCGYAVPWAWTGFRGNTLWDWIELFIVPFAIPVAVTAVGALSNRTAADDRARSEPSAAATGEAAATRATS